MKFYKTLTIACISATIIGVIVLIFQGTLYLVFGEWYSFSILDILLRTGLRDRLYTGVDGFDDTIDMLLDISLPVTFILLGSVVGLISYKLWQREKDWYRPG